MDTNQIKKQFPIFQEQPDLIYLDNGATTQKPTHVIDAETRFYQTSNANIHRGIYRLSEQATMQYEQARETLAEARADRVPDLEGAGVSGQRRFGDGLRGERRR